MTPSTEFLIRRLRLRHFQLLEHLGQTGSLRAAAGALSVTQPAVSKMLHEIEQAFGMRLFERGRRGVEPNAFGLIAIHHARAILGEVDRAAEEINAMRGGANAILRLGTLSITSIVPAAIVDLCARNPGAQVRIREAALRDLLPMLLDGELDCVFGAMTSDALERPVAEAVGAQMIFEDWICAIVADSHPLSGAGHSDWASLAAERWVAPPRETPIRQQFIASFLQLGLKPPVPVIETLSPVTMIELLRLDPTLIALVRFESVRNDTLAGMRRLEIRPRMPLPPLCVLTRARGGPMPEIVGEFIAALRRAAQPARQKKTNTPGSA